MNVASSVHRRADGLEIGERAFGEPGEERRAERRRLLVDGTADRNAEQVGLELQHRVHRAGAAVDAQLGDRRAAGAHHRLDDVAGLVGHRLDHGAGEVRLGGPAGDADHRAPGVGIPPRRAEPGERGDDEDAAVVGDALRQRTDLVGALEQPEAVAQPLHGRSR